MKKLLILIPLLVVLPFAYFTFPRVIKINSIHCSSQYGPCNYQIEELVSIAKDKNLLEAKPLLGSTLSESQLVSEYDIRFMLLDTIEVYVVEQKAVVAIKTTDLPSFTLLSEEGEVLGEASETQLPKILLDQQIDDLNLGFMAQLISSLFNIYGVRLVSIRDDGAEVNFSTGLTAIYPLEGDVDVLLGATSLVLSQLNSNLEDHKIEIMEVDFLVDFRFNNPVVYKKDG